MVNVADKPVTQRMAIAEGEVWMKKPTLAIIKAGALKKGDLITTAELAGVMAAKRTHELIPLCHPLAINQIKVELSFDDELPGIRIQSIVRSEGKTGVEMEALTAVSVAALTVYDMAKAVESTMQIQNIRLIEKVGGQSGDIRNEVR